MDGHDSWSLHLQIIAEDVRANGTTVRRMMARQDIAIGPLNSIARAAVEAAIRELQWWVEQGQEQQTQRKDAA